MTPYHVLHHGRGPALLLLHGFTGSSESWTPLLPALSEHFRVLAVDLPGHGRTNAGDDVAAYAVPRVVDELVRVLDEHDAATAHVLGYSMGGRVALALAAHAPARVKRLLLESASPGLATAAERAVRVAADEALAARIEARGIEAFVDEWERLPLFASQASLPEEVRRRVRVQRLRCDPRGLALSLRGMGTGAQPPLWDALPRLRMPVHLLVGGRDAKFVAIARDMQRAVPHAALTIAPDAGHTVHLEDPATWTAVVTAYSAETESAL
jgi:2-succinyl-6-hydroxy-2,4-cyclohexadiene-1-carboxylate synthase